MRAIADGRQPKPWKATFTHPFYGELTFTGALPTTLQIHSQLLERDRLMQGMSPEPSWATLQSASSISGIRTLLGCPVVREDRTPDPDNSHDKITKVHYDPATDPVEDFPFEVWSDFSEWRNSFLVAATQKTVEKSFGETVGDDSNDSSSTGLVSPSTTPA
jgi:hypothetical protein